MLIEGKNRYMIIELSEREPDTENLVLLPDDYKVQESDHGVGVIKECGSCSERYEPGGTVVFPRHLLQEFVFKGETFYLVLENHILCSIVGD